MVQLSGSETIGQADNESEKSWLSEFNNRLTETGHIKILECKFYAMRFFQAFWLVENY